jgi:hypothetical protein
MQGGPARLEGLRATAILVLYSSQRNYTLGVNAAISN